MAGVGSIGSQAFAANVIAPVPQVDFQITNTSSEEINSNLVVISDEGTMLAAAPTTDDVLLNKDINKGTLDTLHDAGVGLPDYSWNDQGDGSWGFTQNSDIQYGTSGYKVGNGDYTITKYTVQDAQTYTDSLSGKTITSKQVQATNLKIGLPTKELGDVANKSASVGTKSIPHYYKWTEGGTLSEVGSADQADFTWYQNVTRATNDRGEYEALPDSLLSSYKWYSNYDKVSNTWTLNFINNKSDANYNGIRYPIQTGAYGQGGAINTNDSWGYNTFGNSNINGDFIGNEATQIPSVTTYNGKYSWYNWGAFGGAIFNSSSLYTIKGDFINNTANTEYNGSGGAVANRQYAYIDRFVSNFVNNKATQGGAIYNDGTIKTIDGNFYGNTAVKGLDHRDEEKEYNDKYNLNLPEGIFTGQGYGGAIQNNKREDTTGMIGNLHANFIGNKAEVGGAIHNSGLIKVIAGDFIGNVANESSGGIYNSGTIDQIAGDFIGNKVKGREYGAHGGAILNKGNLNTVYGDFISNSALNGGAVSNSSNITKFVGNFYNNEATSGGAIYNSGYVADLKANFIGNKAAEKDGGYGGAIHNSVVRDEEGKITAYGNFAKIEGNFINNSAQIGGAIHNGDGVIDDIKGDLIGNKATESSGAIYNSGYIKNVKGNFITNEAVSKDADVHGGALLNSGQIDNLNGDFVNNKAESQNGAARGGAIFNTGTINELKNISFVNNSAVSKNGQAQGGAIFTTSDMTITTEGQSGGFSGNIVVSNGKKVQEAVFVAGKGATLNLNANKKAEVYINDRINGVDGYKANLKSDESSNFYINNSIMAEGGAADVSLEGNFWMSKDTYFNNDDMNLKGGFLSMRNNTAGIAALNSMTVTGNTDFVADVDLADRAMDRFTAKEYGVHNGNINVVGMNLVSDASEKDDTVAVYFAQPGLKENVTQGFGEVGKGTNHKWQGTAYTPKYKYSFEYDKVNQYDGKGDGGYFVFTRSGGKNNPDRYNPAVLASPVATQAAGGAAINEVFRYVFEHADAFTQLPNASRLALFNANKYALSTDFNENRGSLNYDTYEENKAGWFRGYSTFEKFNLKHGPKVDAITYGALVGFDGDFKEHKHGWHSMGTGYIGYMGSQLDYKGVDTSMNGGMLGYTETFYKGNFWTALTASAGAAVAETRTMYGKEDNTMFLAGVANKTGYNFEYKEGKYILQPIMQLSYTFVNAFDYTNAAGLKIKNDPMHTIQLNPSVRFINNRNNGWQPYAQVGVVWNLLNETKSTASGTPLPSMHTKPYIEYGVGIQRNWKDKYTAFGQAMVRNGGRNGVALTAGFRWAIGRDPNEQKVEAPAKKIVKQIDQNTKAVMTKNQTITTRTANQAVLKQL